MVKAPSTSRHKSLLRNDSGPADGALFTVDSITGAGMKKIADRYYQVEAVKAVVEALREGGRGQLRTACGTGKTVMAQRCAELLCPHGGLAVVLCPSIDLVAQTLREWAVTNSDHAALAVCGDETVKDSFVTIADLSGTVTTDAEEVARWLRTPTTAGLRLIVGTHRSAHVIGEALIAVGQLADLLVVDEAHRSAGAVRKHTALVHEDHRLPAQRRLYATATPKIVGEKVNYSYHKGAKRTVIKTVVGMDDEAVFGPVLYEYPFAQAIDDGYLDDYRLVVMGATRAEIMKHLAGLPRDAIAGNSTTSLHTAMVQTVLAKAAVQYGMRRVLTFCNRLNEAADFARSMNRTLSGLPADMRPARRLTTSYVHGGMSTADRRLKLDLLVDPPEDGWTVLTNVRCLAEGVDVPAIDGIVFTYPKQSVSEIVQAIGRALRRNPAGTGTATILVPILLPDDPRNPDETDVADYRLLWQVIRALRAHDTKLGATLDRAPSPRHDSSHYHYDEQPLEHVLVNLPPGYDDGSFLHHLTAQIISSARSPWWDNFAALRDFHAEHGHVTVPGDHVTANGVNLGSWTDTVRVTHRQGRLAPDRVEALTELGFDFLPRAVEWAAGLRAATAFHAEHGTLEPAPSLKVLGVELRVWLDKQRGRAASSELAESRRAALDALGMRWHDEPATFDEYLTALIDHHRRHGHIAIAPDPTTADGRLGSWLVSVRIDRRRGLLTDEQIAQLDALGMAWTRRPTASPTPSPRSTTA